MIPVQLGFVSMENAVSFPLKDPHKIPLFFQVHDFRGAIIGELFI